jgi:histidine triad (HIT) family protein
MVPKVHIASAADISEVNDALVGHMFTKIAEIARQEGLENGFRVVSNVGEDGGQTVHHLHFHLLGGKPLSGNMG